MPLATQAELQFACLDFSGRGAVAVWEIAQKLGVSRLHVINLIQDGSITAIDTARHRGNRSNMRVPVEEYRRFVISRLTGPARKEFLAHLPVATLRDISREIAQLLVAA